MSTLSFVSASCQNAVKIFIFLLVQLPDLSFSSLQLEDVRAGGVKTLVRLFIFELWTESLRAVRSWPWKLEIERRERTNLVWFGDESQLFVRLFYIGLLVVL